MMYVYIHISTSAGSADPRRSTADTMTKPQAVIGNIRARGVCEHDDDGVAVQTL